jgi:peptidoglycan/xylan/chitin deacetylase (PgdA/CDA1 family)
MGRLRRRVRGALCEAAYRSGRTDARLRRAAGRAAVLMYHRVLPAGDPAIPLSQPGMYVTAESFRMQMAFLRERFHVLSLDGFIDGLADGFPADRPACLVTFDDGWRDTLTVALPILREHAVPGVVFLATDFVGGSETYWTETAARAFSLLHRRLRAGDAATVPGLEDLTTPEHARRRTREVFVDAVLARLKSTPPPERARILDAARAAAGFLDADAAPEVVDWDGVAALAAGGVVPGGHTRSHALLTELSREEQRREIAGCRRAIAERTGRAPRAFCYPNGNLDTGIVELVGEAGFEVAFSVRSGMVRPGEDPLVLPRFSIHDDATFTPARFGAWLARGAA